jgi:dihydroorotate dehydrogenase (NAD+) catalytic subunit
MAKHDLTFDPPVMNAAGTLGFSPDLHNSIDWSKLGAFVTNPISVTPRTPANGIRFVPYPGGFLLHTGFPNPGLASALRHYARHWQRSPVPVIVHLLARNVEELSWMARRLENVDGVSGLEIGLTSDVRSDMVSAYTQAACGELPVIIQLPMDRCAELAAAAIHVGAVAVSLAPPRGLLPFQGGELVQGRLYGKAVLPNALRVIWDLKSQGIPTIGAGGVYTEEQLDSMLAAGATAVQLDSVIWRGVGFELLK